MVSTRPTQRPPSAILAKLSFRRWAPWFLCWLVMVAFDAQAEVERHSEQHSLHYGVHLPQDRQLARALGIAEQLLRQGRYGESLPVIIKVLQASEDAYRLDGPTAEGEGDKSTPKSLKSEAARLILGLDKEGYRAYLLEVGAESKRAYLEAVTKGDAALARVAANYPRTDAGRASLWVLAQRAADRDSPDVAAAYLVRLLGEPEIGRRQREQLTAQLVLMRLRQQDRDSALKLLKKQPAARGLLTDSFDLGDADSATETQWLDLLAAVYQATPPDDSSLRRAWLTAGGDSRRNPLIDAPCPHLWARWVRESSGQPRWLSLSSHETAMLADSSAGACPLVQGDTVVARNWGRLCGVDRETGKLKWETLLLAAEPEAPSDHYVRRMRFDQNQLARFLQGRLRDAVVSRISSDGRRVFSVAELPTAGKDAGEGYGNSRFHPAYTFLSQRNEIVAVDVAAEGKLAWRTGPSDAFYLGTPLALGDRLYAAVEAQQTIYLEELDTETGESLWRQPLASVETAVDQVPMRRLAGAELAAGNGLVLCSTGAGTLVAVSPMDHTLRWVFRFPADGGAPLGRSRQWQGISIRRMPTALGDAWLRNQMIVDGDRVYVGSPESRQLHSVDLATGKRLWSSREGAPQLLCAVAQGVVLTARSDAVTGVDIHTGKSRWTVRLPHDARPSGVGGCFGGKFLLPLSTGETLLLDIASGGEIDRKQIGPEGMIGNLAFDGTSVYSQSFAGLARFDLGSTFEGPDQALRQAQQLAMEGDLELAIESLLKIPPDDRSAEVGGTLRDLLTRKVEFASRGDGRLRAIEDLYQGRLRPIPLRLALLTRAAGEGDAGAVVAEVVDFCRSGQPDELMAKNASHAVRASSLFRAVVEQSLSEADQAGLRRQLASLVGPNRRALAARVLPSLPVEFRDAAPRTQPDQRWVSYQVKPKQVPREGKTRQQTRTRPSGELSEFSLPLSRGWDQREAEGPRLTATSDGRVLGFNYYGEEVMNVEMPKSSPDRLKRMARKGATVAAVVGDLVMVSTGEDVVAIAWREPGQPIRWSARECLAQSELLGRGLDEARLESSIQAAAVDEVRLVGASPRGVAVVADELAACLDPESGVILWVRNSVDASGSPKVGGSFVYSSPHARPGWRLSLRDGARETFDAPSGKCVAAVGPMLALLEAEDRGARLKLHDRSAGMVTEEREFGEGLQTTTLDGLLVAVDNSGAVEVIDLARAKVLLADKLKLSAEVVDVSAVRMGDRLYVGVNLVSTHSHRAAGVLPIDFNPLLSGPIMAYSLRTGRATWPSPALVEHKSLLARQPEGCPVLALAANAKMQDSSGRYDALNVVMLDAATGRTLHAEESLRNENAREYRVRFTNGPDPRYTLALESRYVTLDLTQSPTPPAPPYTAKVEERETPDLWSVGNALGRLIEERLEKQQPDPTDDD